MKQIWIERIVRHPWLILLIGFALIVAASAGGSKLYFRGDYKVFFEPENPQRVAFEELQTIFSKNETSNIIIAPHSGDVFTLETPDAD